MIQHPYTAANFLVEIDGLLLGGFSKVSGLDIETETETIQEGGVNNFTYKLPSQTSYSDLVLENGIVEYSQLWPWYQGVVQGRIQRRNGSIYLLNTEGNKVFWWNFLQAFPHSWKGPSFDASQASVAIQQISLAHHGLSEAQGRR